MRFDDSLKTVLAADMAPGYGAQAAWRQLVDLAGRRRIALDEATLARLTALREAVPPAVRAASARALAFSGPPAALVGFFAQDEPSAAAPVLRAATLPPEEWLALLPRLDPRGRGVLRGRRDLAPEVVRGLESFGATDFALPFDAPEPALDPETATGGSIDAPAPASIEPPAPLDAPRSPSPFVPLGEVARGLPFVAEAIRRADEPANDRPANDRPANDRPANDRFEIADIVARIDAFRRDRPAFAASAPDEAAPLTRFRFATDERGAVRWVEGGGRAALVGVSLAHSAPQGLARVDAGVAAAVRGRARIDGGRLEVGGAGEVAGSWRIVAEPDFDPASGRFVGYSGLAARPSRDQRAEAGGTADGLRQLVHELRTPANAVAGFAEFIEAELLGPVPGEYRARAASIRRQAGDLLAAIEDLDTAARLDAGALDARPGETPLAALVGSVAATLVPLAERNGASVTVEGGDAAAALEERVAERLVSRLLGALVATASPGERIVARVSAAADGAIVAVDRPAALAGLDARALLALGGGEEADGGPLLGAGFSLRLVRNLAAEVGGELAVEPGRLTLRLPAIPSGMDMASAR